MNNCNSFVNMASIGDFDPLNASIPATKVEITVSCRNLLDMDTFSKSDPICVLYTQGIGNKEWREFGRTEVIENTLNPEFVRKFILDYFFEERQNLRFDLNEDGTFTICHKTEVVKNTLNPVWQAFKIPVRALCNGDYDRTIKIECYDWERDGSHDFIGEFTTSYRELSRGQSQFNVYEVSVCVFTCVHASSVPFYIWLCCSIIVPCYYCPIIYHYCTCFPGNPAQPTSLHYMSPYQMNAYAMALKAVGEIIQDYDSDKMFPALGFGAKLPPDGRVSHEFALNGNPQNPYCAGIDGVMEAYYQSLKSVCLYGPTNFSPVINHVARYAASVNDGSQYFVLLIITDGVISDMAQTKESIVNASCLPMSIIIVGVGPAEFDAMIELDGDEVRISSRGRYAERDIVQFVPFRDYIDRTGNHILSMARLAKDVLAEIPDQFLSYMRTRGIKPLPTPPPYTPPGYPVQSPNGHPLNTPPGHPLQTQI
uniref:C2 domain-containing protein n=1 Tax=Oncorhynchus tshawytscha TaxID=74940 RepID=A0A8C8D5G6_ONCTS